MQGGAPGARATPGPPKKEREKEEEENNQGVITLPGEGGFIEC